MIETANKIQEKEQKNSKEQKKCLQGSMRWKYLTQKQKAQ